MPNANRPYQGKDTRWFDVACADVYQCTKPEERRILALAWSSGNFDFYKEFASNRHLVPAAVIVACLDEVDHPIAVEARTPFFASARILIAELRYPLSTPPVDKGELVHRQAVTETVTACVSTKS